MASYDIRQLQLHILDNLITFDHVCREHHLCYYLVAGTLLGAVRHKGFIPWDDDIDVAMPRSDYDQLIQHANQWIPQPYELKCAEHDADYPSDFGKFINSNTTLVEREHHSYIGGIYVDVFPLDSITSNPFRQRIHFMEYTMLKKLLYLLCRNPYKHGHGLSSWPALLCQQLFKPSSVVKRLLKVQQTYSCQDSPLIVDHDFGRRGVMDKTIYGTPVEISFEGHQFYGVAKTHEYLSAIYGDYMTIPPGPKQKQHNFFLLDYQLPYRQYVDPRDFVRHSS